MGNCRSKSKPFFRGWSAVWTLNLTPRKFSVIEKDMELERRVKQFVLAEYRESDFVASIQ